MRPPPVRRLSSSQPTPSPTPCEGKVFTVEMHHKRVDEAHPGDNVGMNIKGLEKINMPRTGDVMIYKKDTTLKACKNFNAQVQAPDVPGQLKPGYSPVAFVRCGRSACKMTELIFKVGKETGGKKMESLVALKSNEVAEAVFEPQHPFVVDHFKACDGLAQTVPRRQHRPSCLARSPRSSSRRTSKVFDVCCL